MKISQDIKAYFADYDFFQKVEKDKLTSDDNLVPIEKSTEKKAKLPRETSREVNPATERLREYAKDLLSFFEEKVSKDNFFLEESSLDKVANSLKEMSKIALDLENDKHNEIKQIVYDMFNLIVLVADNQKFTLNKLSSLLGEDFVVDEKNFMKLGKLCQHLPRNILYCTENFDRRKHKLILEFIEEILQRIQETEVTHDDECLLKILLLPVKFMHSTQEPLYFTDNVLR